MQESDVIAALRDVIDPKQNASIVQLGLVRDIAISDTTISITLKGAGVDSPRRTHLQQACSHALATRSTDHAFHIAFEDSERDTPSVLPEVEHVIAVGAGKGGVGKSTVSTLLALALSRRGDRCGLLDGDIYGPSLGTMLGLDDMEPTVKGERLQPFSVHGISSMTIAKLVDSSKPMIWRGPMAHKAFSQLLLQTDWGALNHLLVDLPPGTGDVPLSLSQALPLSGAVIVCTPQRVAQDDARRAIGMFGQLGVPILGVVENMSWFIADDDKEYDLFGRGGAARMAEEMGVPFLGPLPLHIDMRKFADAGTPSLCFDIHPDVTASLEHIASQLIKQLKQNDGKTVMPTISVS